MGYHHYYAQKNNFYIALSLLLLILINFEVHSQHVSNFDSLGPDVQSLKINNKTIYYIELWHITNQQDWKICEKVQRGMNSVGFEQGYYGWLNCTKKYKSNRCI